MTVTNEDVLRVLFHAMQPQHRAILCSLPGDPYTADKRAWTGIPWGLDQQCKLRPDWNNYVAVSSFAADEDGKFKRRKGDFGALHGLMVDDLGTKVPLSKLAELRDRHGLHIAFAVETSPGNVQAVYVFREPITDMEEADALIRGAIHYFVGEDGADPGMAGVTRVFRLPQGVNGKAKYEQDGKPYECRVLQWTPDKRVDWKDMARAVQAHVKRSSYVEPNDGVTAERKRSFGIVKQGLQALRAIKKQGRGWLEIRCPWVADHTDRADSGAAVAFPAPKNGFIGGFRCHHGHCASRGWGDLENWVCDELARDAKATAGIFTGLLK